jgi:hypothetical protein
VTYEHFDRLKAINTSPEVRRAWRKLMFLTGKHVASAATLEDEIGGLVQAFMVPDDPMKEAGFVQPLSAYSRSDFLRKLLKDPGGPHWKTLFNEVQNEAAFRNNIAHGAWSNHAMLPDGNIEIGWFLENRKQRKDGSWYMRSTKITEADFMSHERRVKFLSTTVRVVRFHIIARYFLTGEHEFPTELGRLVETFPFYMGWRSRWYRALTQELFPPAP